MFIKRFVSNKQKDNICFVSKIMDLTTFRHEKFLQKSLQGFKEKLDNVIYSDNEWAYYCWHFL